jgi:hypothetical protein
MDSDTANVSSDELDFPCMDANPNREIHVAGRASHGDAASDSVRRTIEDGEKTVAGGCQLASSVGIEGVSQPGVVLV